MIELLVILVLATVIFVVGRSSATVEAMAKIGGIAALLYLALLLLRLLLKSG